MIKNTFQNFSCETKVVTVADYFLQISLHVSYIRKYVCFSGASPEGGQSPSKPGKFAKAEEQLTPQPAMKINSRRKFKFKLNFFKFSKTFKIFKIVSKICSNLLKFFSRTVVNLIQNIVYLNSSKLY